MITIVPFFTTPNTLNSFVQDMVANINIHGVPLVHPYLSIQVSHLVRLHQQVAVLRCPPIIHDEQLSKVDVINVTKVSCEGHQVS